MNVFFLMLVLFIPSLLPSLALADNIKIGILAFQPLPIEQVRWQALTEYLNQEVPQHHFEILPLNYAQLNRAVQEHSLNFIFTNPGHYVTLKEKHLINRAMVTLVNEINGKPYEQFGGVIFTLADRDDIPTLRSLSTKKIASVANDSFGGFQMQAYEFFREGIEYSDLNIEWTEMPHDKVVQAVLQHKADAGFVRTGVLERMIKNGELRSDQIQIIHKIIPKNFLQMISTELYSEWPFAALVGEDEDHERFVASALLQLPHNGKVAQSIGIHGFNITADYSDVRKVLYRMQMPPFDILPTYFLSTLWHKYHLHLIFSLCLLFVIMLYLIHLRHMTQRLSKLTAKLDRLNHIDGLTNIGNRRHFDEEYEKELNRAVRQRSSIAVIMIDIDFFKQFNDVYGHLKGDDCLKQVASTLAEEPHRITDMAFRYGGEEFVLILPNTSSDAAMAIAERLRERIEGLNIAHKKSTVSDVVTISLGVAASIPVDSSLIDVADKALYSAKETRNMACLYKHQ